MAVTSLRWDGGHDYGHGQMGMVKSLEGDAVVALAMAWSGLGWGGGHGVTMVGMGWWPWCDQGQGGDNSSRTPLSVSPWLRRLWWAGLVH